MASAGQLFRSKAAQLGVRGFGLGESEIDLDLPVCAVYFSSNFGIGIEEFRELKACTFWYLYLVMCRQVEEMNNARR